MMCRSELDLSRRSDGVERAAKYRDHCDHLFLKDVFFVCKKTEVKNLLYASSSSVYGGNTKVPFSEIDSVNHPISLYAATKRSNELMAHSYSHLYGLPCTGLRFYSLWSMGQTRYGPNDIC